LKESIRDLRLLAYLSTSFLRFASRAIIDFFAIQGLYYFIGLYFNSLLECFLIFGGKFVQNYFLILDRKDKKHKEFID
tara:strand:- start:293 stop:526 length:234 start_codon:yes stop_codon:yes gene_type:complete